MLSIPEQASCGAALLTTFSGVPFPIVLPFDTYPTCLGEALILSQWNFPQTSVKYVILDSLLNPVSELSGHDLLRESDAEKSLSNNENSIHCMVKKMIMKASWAHFELTNFYMSSTEACWETVEMFKFKGN